MDRRRQREEIRVLFLLPELTDYERHLLTNQREWRLAAMLACNGDPAEHEAEDEEIARNAEQGFMDAKMAVLRAGIREKLSPVQREVLDVEFLKTWLTIAG